MNEVISYQEFENVLKNFGVPENSAGSRVVMLYGKHVLFYLNDIVLWEKCAFCGTKNPPERKEGFGFYCPRCTAPVRWVI